MQRDNTQPRVDYDVKITMDDWVKELAGIKSDELSANLYTLRRKHPELFKKPSDVYKTMIEVKNNPTHFFKNNRPDMGLITKRLRDNSLGKVAIAKDSGVVGHVAKSTRKNELNRLYNVNSRELGVGSPYPTPQSTRALVPEHGDGVNTLSPTTSGSIISNQSLNQNITKDDILKEIVNLRNQGFKFGNDMDENLNLVLNKIKNDRLNTTSAKNAQVPNNGLLPQPKEPVSIKKEPLSQDEFYLNRANKYIDELEQKGLKPEYVAKLRNNTLENPHRFSDEAIEKNEWFMKNNYDTLFNKQGKNTNMKGGFITPNLAKDMVGSGVGAGIGANLDEENRLRGAMLGGLGGLAGRHMFSQMPKLAMANNNIKNEMIKRSEVLKKDLMYGRGGLNKQKIKEISDNLPKKFNSLDEFEKSIGTKGDFTIDTPIEKINTNTKKIWKHMAGENTYLQDRVSFSGAFMDTLKDPLFVIRNPIKKQNEYYKTFKTKDGITNLISIAKKDNGEMVHKTFFDINDYKFMEAIDKTLDKNVLYYKLGGEIKQGLKTTSDRGLIGRMPPEPSSASNPSGGIIQKQSLNNNKMKGGFTTQAMVKNIVSSGIGGGIGAYSAPNDKKLEGFIIGALGGMGASNFGGISHSAVNLVKNMIKTPKGIDKAIEKGVDKGLVGVANKFLSKEAAKTWSDIGGNVGNIKYFFTNTLDKSYEKVRDSVTGELNAMFNKYVNLSGVLNQLSKKDNKAFYDFLANNGSIENLSLEIRKFANDVRNQIIKEFEYQVGAKLIDENTAKEFSGNFLSRIYENEGLKSKFKDWISSSSSAFGIDPIYKRGLEKTIGIGEYQRLKALGKIAVKGDKGFSTGGKWILNEHYDEKTLLKMADEISLIIKHFDA